MASSVPTFPLGPPPEPKDPRRQQWDALLWKYLVTTANGVVPVDHGGTGLTSGTSGGVPYFSSTTTMASSALLGATQVVLGGGAGAAPNTSANLTFSGSLLAVTGSETISGTMAVGGSANAKAAVTVTGTFPVDANQSYGFTSTGTLPSTATVFGGGQVVVLSTANATATYGLIADYYAGALTKGATDTVTEYHAYYVQNIAASAATLTTAFRGGVNSGTGRWNAYLSGTAANYINGNLQLGSTTATAGAEKLQVTGAASVSTTLAVTTSIAVGGVTATATNSFGTPQINAASNSFAVMGVSSHNASDANFPAFTFARSLGTQASPTVVTSTSTLGTVLFTGYDGVNSAYRSAAEIRSLVDGAVSSGVVPGSLVIRTANASGTMTTALTISSAQLATFAGDVAVNGGDLTTSQTTFNLLNATATTLNVGGAATTVSAGASTGTFTVNNTTLAAKAITASTTLGVTGITTLGNKLYPATDAAATQTATGIYANTGAPSNANGANGDFYFRADGGALTTIYQRRAGTWVGIV